VQRSVNAKVFATLNKIETFRQFGNKSRQSLIIAAVQCGKGKFNFRALGFGGDGHFCGALHCRVVKLLTTKVHDQLIGIHFEDLTDELPARPCNAHGYLALLQIA